MRKTALDDRGVLAAHRAQDEARRVEHRGRRIPPIGDIHIAAAVDAQAMGLIQLGRGPAAAVAGESEVAVSSDRGNLADVPLVTLRMRLSPYSEM